MPIAGPEKECLLAELRHQLCVYARGWMQHADAEDVAQHGIIRCDRLLEAGKTPQELSALPQLFRKAFQDFLDQYRSERARAGRQEMYVAAHGDRWATESAADRYVDALDLYRRAAAAAREYLSPKRCEVFIATCLDGLTKEAAACRFRCSVKTITAHIEDARYVLGPILADQGVRVPTCYLPITL